MFVLTNTNTYTGTTAITGGTLRLQTPATTIYVPPANATAMNYYNSNGLGSPFCLPTNAISGGGMSTSPVGATSTAGGAYQSM